MLRTSIDSIQIYEDPKSLTYEYQRSLIFLNDDSCIAATAVIALPLPSLSLYSALAESLFLTRIICAITELSVTLLNGVELVYITLSNNSSREAGLLGRYNILVEKVLPVGSDIVVMESDMVAACSIAL